LKIAPSPGQDIQIGDFRASFLRAAVCLEGWLTKGHELETTARYSIDFPESSWENV
jgi:hypothetical protein